MASLVKGKNQNSNGTVYTSKNMLKICYFPGRESHYARTRVIIKGMREAGIEVFDCSYPKRTFFRYAVGFCKFLIYKNRSDIIFIGFFGHIILLLIRLFTRKKILFDAFISVYQTMAFDRKFIRPNGIFAQLSRFLDRISCQLADKVFLDTNQHIEYFTREYKLDKSKFIRLFAGSDDSVMHPHPEIKTEDFLVHFHGELQPLHGVEYIIKAAKNLPNVKFQLIGKGKILNSCMEKVRKFNLKNTTFIPPVNYENLAKYMSKASICLGIFGNTQKAKMVIPHKVYEALAVGKPIITSDTPAAREILKNEENAILCKPAHAQSLSESIVKLRDNEELRKKIAKKGNQLFLERCTPFKIGKQIFQAASEIVDH